MTYALDRCQVRMKKCADQYVFILDMYDLGYVNFDLKLISALSPIIQVRILHNYFPSNHSSHPKPFRETMLTL
jgi:hypothetical protein